jgi:hypothetical protein
VTCGREGNLCCGTRTGLWLVVRWSCVPTPFPSRQQLRMRLVLCGEVALRTLQWSSLVRRVRRELAGSE